MVEHRTPEQEVGVRNLPLPCCFLEQDTLLSESTGNIQEAVAPFGHDLKKTIDGNYKKRSNFYHY